MRETRSGRAEVVLLVSLVAAVTIFFGYFVATSMTW